MTGLQRQGKKKKGGGTARFGSCFKVFTVFILVPPLDAKACVKKKRRGYDFIEASELGEPPLTVD